MTDVSAHSAAAVPSFSLGWWGPTTVFSGSGHPRESTHNPYFPFYLVTSPEKKKKHAHGRLPQNHWLKRSRSHNSYSMLCWYHVHSKQKQKRSRLGGEADGRKGWENGRRGERGNFSQDVKLINIFKRIKVNIIEDLSCPCHWSKGLNEKR